MNVVETRYARAIYDTDLEVERRVNGECDWSNQDKDWI